MSKWEKGVEERHRQWRKETLWSDMIPAATVLLIVLIFNLFSGCVDYSDYCYDREHFRDRLNEQSHRIYQVERDMIQLKRGYTFVPVKVMITNRTEVAK